MSDAQSTATTAPAAARDGAADEVLLEARDDVELWGAALRLLPADSPRRALAVATLERIERDLA